MVNDFIRKGDVKKLLCGRSSVFSPKAFEECTSWEKLLQPYHLLHSLMYCIMSVRYL